LVRPIHCARRDEEIATRARSADITLKSERHDTEWKTRAFKVIDPSGFVWPKSRNAVYDSRHNRQTVMPPR
jgi:hypothetical protein